MVYCQKIRKFGNNRKRFKKNTHNKTKDKITQYNKLSKDKKRKKGMRVKKVKSICIQYKMSIMIILHNNIKMNLCIFYQNYNKSYPCQCHLKC